MLLNEFIKDKGIDKYYKSPLYIKFSLLAHYISLVLEGDWIGDLKPIPDDFSTVPAISKHFRLMPTDTPLRVGDVYIILYPRRYRYGVFTSSKSVIEQTSPLTQQHQILEDDIKKEIDNAIEDGHVVRILRPVNTKNIEPAELFDFQKFTIDYFDAIALPQNDFIEPTYSQTKQFISALRLLTAQSNLPYFDIDIEPAKAIFETFDYDVIKAHDSFDLTPFVAIYPNNPNTTDFNWGMYRMNMDGGFSSIITAPHPKTDANSEIISVITNAMQRGQLVAIATCIRSVNDYMRTSVKVSSNSTTGSLVFGFRGNNSVSVPFDADNETVLAAVKGITGIGNGNVKVWLDSLIEDGGLIIQLDAELRDDLNPTDTITVTPTGLDGTLTVAHEADHARNSGTMLHNVVKEYQGNSSCSNLQYHGFDDENRGVDIVLSSSRTIPSTVYFETLHTLRANGYNVLARLDGDTQTLVFSKTITGGTFTLDFYDQITGNITFVPSNYTQTGVNIAQALIALDNVGERNVTVVKSFEDSTTVIFVVKFENDLSGLEERMTIDSSGLTGTDIVAEVHNGSNVVLAALTNLFGLMAQENLGQFVHVEISSSIRNDVIQYQKLATILGSINYGELSGRSVPIITRNKFIPDQVVLSVGLSQAVGDSPYGANALHRHPWSNDDQIAGGHYIASRNSENTGNTWLSPQEVKEILDFDDGPYVAKAGDTMTGALVMLNTTVTAGSGTGTDTFVAAYKITRNGVTVGQIDNNSSGLRLRALTGDLQLGNSSATLLTMTQAGVVSLASALALTSGGTGATTASDARTNLGLGTSATINLSTNGTFSENSDSLIPSQKAVKTYVDTNIAGGVIYKGGYDPSTNTPTLANGTGKTGDQYKITVAGSRDFGSGSITFAVGDYVIYNGSQWEKIDTTDQVTSVFSRQGAIVATVGDYTASQITNVAAGNISATNVQSALNELDTEKAGLGINNTFTGLTIFAPTNSTSAVVIQNATMTTTPFRVDTTNNRVGIGGGGAPGSGFSVNVQSYFGSMTAAATALVHIGGGTTARASLRLESGVAPTTPNEGDIWRDGSDLKIYIGGTTKTFTLI